MTTQQHPAAGDCTLGSRVPTSGEHHDNVRLLNYTQNKMGIIIEELDRERESGDEGEKLCKKLPGDAIEDQQRSGQVTEPRVADSNWTVALGAFIIMMMINMVGPCFSIIFSPFLLDLGASSTTVGWIFNSMLLLWFTCGVYVGPLVEEYSWRGVAMACSVTFACSLALSAFATSPLYLFFSYSVLCGISGGLLNTLGFLIVPHYCTRHRGVANACMTAGACMGQMLGPLLIGFLQDEFGFFGATFILGAIMLHCCVGASFFRPLQGQTRTSEKPDHLEADAAETAENKSTCSFSNNAFLRVLYKSASNLSVLKSPPAAIIAIGGVFMLNSYLNFMALMPFAMLAAGHSIHTASLYLTVSAVCNLMARLTVSVLSDWSKFSMRGCCMTSVAATVVSTLAFSVVAEARWRTFIMGVWGCGVGGYMGLFNLIIVHYMGLDKLASTMGTTLLLVGCGFITIGPCIGVIRDVSGSYAVSMWVLAGLASTCFTLWIFMPAATRYHHKSLKTSP
nr:monocarboxylate transporter 4-like [Procambarus clarkii]